MKTFIIKLILLVSCLIFVVYLDIHIIFKIILYVALGYGILFNSLVFLNILVAKEIQKCEESLLDIVVSNHEKLISLYQSYIKEYVETKQFHEEFNILISSSDKKEIDYSVNFFKTYNRFDCHDRSHEFIKTLFVYCVHIHRLNDDTIKNFRKGEFK